MHSATLRCTPVCSLVHCTLVCNNGVVPTESSRVRSMNETRDRILDVALDVLGENPDAGMGDIASAAGVVRRTVYGHFPSRLDLIRTLTERAVTEMTAVLAEVSASGAEADAMWAEFIARVWPVAHRYRVLLALRRGEYGEAIHGLLGRSEEHTSELQSHVNLVCRLLLEKKKKKKKKNKINNKKNKKKKKKK